MTVKNNWDLLVTGLRYQIEQTIGDFGDLDFTVQVHQGQPVSFAVTRFRRLLKVGTAKTP